LPASAGLLSCLPLSAVAFMVFLPAGLFGASVWRPGPEEVGPPLGRG
jgi:hypothetical protein